eukprot:753472-Hanusia_phi.AAC.2
MNLLCGGVNAGGVVGAGMEHEDGSILSVLSNSHNLSISCHDQTHVHVLAQSIEVKADSVLVVVAVGLERQA